MLLQDWNGEEYIEVDNFFNGKETTHRDDAKARLAIPNLGHERYIPLPIKGRAYTGTVRWILLTRQKQGR